MRPAIGCRAAVVAVVLLGAGAPATAQEDCAAPTDRRAGVVVGGVWSKLAGGDHADGIEAGVEGAIAAGPFAIAAGLQRSTFSGAAAAPLSGRVRITAPVTDLLGVTLCGVALLGGGSLSAEDGEARALAGGLGAVAARRVDAGGLVLVPYLGVRGLGARATGRILDQDFTASGTAVGMEAGAGLERGRFAGALRFSADGLDPALGPVPYPTFALRLMAGWRL